MRASGHRPATLPLWEGFLEEEPIRPMPSSSWAASERVLITGAGGYLGSAVAAALATAGVQHLCLLDVVEHGLYELQTHLETRHPAAAFELVLGSVQDRVLLDEVIRRSRPTLVLHTAALKHVPMLEGNASAAAAVNVLGTATLLEALQGSKVRRAVVCSTDKAVQPVGVMGATKKIAEQIALASPVETYVIRLCNVLGSSGSVAPRFAQQIGRGEPLLLTEREASRLWMSQAVAVRCLLAGLQEALPTRLAIPRHVQQRQVTELAAYMLAKAGVFAPQLAFTGLRRGERLHETMHDQNEVPQGDGSAEVTSLRPARMSPGTLEALVGELTSAVRSRDDGATVLALQRVMSTRQESQT